MTGHDNFHSRLVAWSKIVLPLCALALLSTVFLFARRPQPATDIPYADIEALAEEQRVTAPSFSGVATDGTLLTVTAQTARPLPDRPDTLGLQELRARAEDPSGVRVEMRASTGEIDRAGQNARLGGLTRIESSDGYTMETNGVTADLESGRIVSDGELEVEAPFGNLTAGKLEIESPEEGTGGRRMLFSGGVRLLYRPDAEAGEADEEGSDP